MDVGGWVEILEVGGIAGSDEGMEEGGSEEEREGKEGRPG